MSGTKFRVKKSETHTDSNGVEYEIGAEINQDFPIEAPDGAAGVLTVNNDLGVGNDVIVVNDLGVGNNIEAAGLLNIGTSADIGTTLTANTITDGTLSMTSGNISGVTKLTASEVATDRIEAPILMVTGLNSIYGEEVGITVQDSANSTAYVKVVEGTTNAHYGVELRYNGGDDTPNTNSSSNWVPDMSNNAWALRSLNYTDGSMNAFDVLSCMYTGAYTCLNSTSGVRVGIDTNNNQDGNSKFEIFKGFQIGPNDTDPTSGYTDDSNTEAVERNAVKLLELDLDGGLKLTERDLEIGSDLGRIETIDGNNTPLRLGSEDQDNITMQADGIMIGSNPQTNSITLHSTDKISITGNIEPEMISSLDNKSQLNIVHPTDGNGAIGVSIRKPVHGSSYLEVVEGSLTSNYGGRLAYQGDSSGTGEDLEVGSSDTVALQAINGSTVHNVLTYSYQGNAVDLHSKNDLTLEANSDMYIWADKIELNRRSGNLDLFIKNIEFDQSTTDYYYYMGIESGGQVKKRVGSPFFSGAHVYRSDTEIPLGSSVELVNGKIVISSSKNSKVCAGIVGVCLECTEEAPNRTSLGEKFTSGYVIKVIAVGDSIHENSKGFNVCNENGDIVAGDLLVTSSTPGYLMKQDDDIIRSYTVGKAMENVVFNEQGQATEVYGYIYCG